MPKDFQYPITELYAWIVDDPTGEHGIIALAIGAMPMQAVTSKKSLATGPFKMLAKHAAQETQRPVKLYRFVIAETLEEL